MWVGIGATYIRFDHVEQRWEARVSGSDTKAYSQVRGNSGELLHQKIAIGSENGGQVVLHSACVHFTHYALSPRFVSLWGRPACERDSSERQIFPRC